MITFKPEARQVREADGRWKADVSPNPGGKSKSQRSLQDLARAHTEDAIKALVTALNFKAERVPAAIALLDRGWGKPKQVIEATGEQTINHLHLLAAEIVSREINPQILLEHQRNEPSTTPEQGIADKTQPIDKTGARRAAASANVPEKCPQPDLLAIAVPTE